MSSLINLIDQLARLAIAPLLFGLIGTAAILSLIRNWRIALPVLMVQYALVGILLARAIPAGVAIIKPFAGVIVCLALSLAAQRADSARATRGESVASDRVAHVDWRSVPAQIIIRAIAMVLVLTAAFGMTVRFQLPGLSRELNLAAYTLLACAVLLIGTAPEALNIGVGVLMAISAIELAYTPIDPSVTVSVLLGLMTLLVGIAVSYLALADGGALLRGDEIDIKHRLEPGFDGYLPAANAEDPS